MVAIHKDHKELTDEQFAGLKEKCLKGLYRRQLAWEKGLHGEGLPLRDPPTDPQAGP